MNAKLTLSLWTAFRPFGRAALAGAVLLIPKNLRAQNLFVADHNSSSIYEFTPSGAQSTFASASGINTAFALAFNNAGDLFVAETGVQLNSGNVTEITPDGVQSTVASGLPFPTGLAFSSADDLFVSSVGNIIEITPDGVQSIFASGLSRPEGLAFDSAGDLFVANQGNGTITEFTMGGPQSTFASGLASPNGLAFDSAGDLFVANQHNSSITKITPGGVQSTFASLAPYVPQGLAFNTAGDLFVATLPPSVGPVPGNVYEITPEGAQSIFAPGLNAAGLAFQNQTLPVPEPHTLELLLLGTAAFLAHRRGYLVRQFGPANCNNAFGV